MSAPLPPFAQGAPEPSRRRVLRRVLGSLLAGGVAVPHGPAQAGHSARVPIVPPPIRPRPGLDFRLIDTRSCPQTMGHDAWGCVQCTRFDGQGQALPCSIADVASAGSVQPTLIVVHGNRYTVPHALSDSYLIVDSLDRRGYLQPQTLALAFSWPSERVYLNEVADQNEKGRRAMVAGYALASLLSRFAPGSRIGLIGHSDGARTIATALHLLGGGATNSMVRDPDVQLPWAPPPLRLRSVLIASATDHHWFNPGEKLDRVLPVSESVLNLYNTADIPLVLYPVGRVTDHRRALGRAELHRHDAACLGPYASRLVEHDLRPMLRTLHVFAEVVTHPTVASWVAPYAWAPWT